MVKNEKEFLDTFINELRIDQKNWRFFIKNIRGKKDNLLWNVLLEFASFAVAEHKREMIKELDLILEDAESGISYIGYLNDFIRKRKATYE